MSTDPREAPGVRPSTPDSGSAPRPAPRTARPDTPRAWRVRPGVIVLKVAGAVFFLAAGVLSAPEPVGLAIGLVGAAALSGLAVRDLVAGVRLAADPAGVTVVTGFAGRRRLAWTDIEQIRVDRRSRFGIGTELVEIDAGEQLYLFSANELGEPCEQVVDTLREMRP